MCHTSHRFGCGSSTTRRWLIVTLLTSLSPGPGASGAEAAASAYLVRGGRPVAVLVAPAEPSPPIRMAIDELQYHLHRASGATLRVVDEAEAGALPASTPRVAIGCRQLAAQAGVDLSALPVDTFCIAIRGNLVVFAGHDSATRSPADSGGWNAATLWAVDHYLDTELGVRWLWPGELGTFVPQQRDIAMPKAEFRGRPPLELRQLSPRLAERTLNGSTLLLSDEEYGRMVDEARTWLRRFRLGNRSSLKFGHAFTTWWDQYGATHPEYFAVPPHASGDRQPYPAPRGVKLREASEAVDAAIVAEWQAAGSPDVWNVSPNDGVGFDTSEASRALDDPADQDVDLIWGTASANLTARHVKFWNRLIGKMRPINPKITLTSYAYSAYRSPPMHGLKLDGATVLEIVPTYWAQDDWLGWQEAGAKLVLRPNWWHSGGPAPVIPLHREGEFFKFALDHGMVGFNYDGMHGFWAARGAQYYLTARLSVHPTMTVEQVIDEYCEPFGQSAPAIKEYLAYWEEITERAKYSVAAGGEVPQPTEGRYGQLLKQHGLSTHPLSGSWTVIPLLYTDEVLERGYAILDRASQVAEGGDGYAGQRVQFLRSGLDHLRLTRDVLDLGYLKERSRDQQSRYEQLAQELQAMRHKLTLEHVVWGEVANVYEARRGFAPTMPTIAGSIESLEGK